MVSRVIPVRTLYLVIFGGTGDLAAPQDPAGVFRRFCSRADARKRPCPIGAARYGMDRAGLQQMIREAIAEFNVNFRARQGQLEGFLTV